MCGIVGYIGKRNVVPILIAGLKRLEYRGYDSAGVAVIEDDRLQVVKEAGKISKLEETINQADYVSTIGIGHTRWATHGEPTRLNAHPHTDGPENIAIIHNGIIENYNVLKSMLENKGHQFSSDTDTEIVAHLIDEFYQGDFEEAFRRALGELTGAYGFAVISKYEPDKIYVARQGSPLVVGVGDGENFLASDVSAIISHTRNVFYLNDGEMAVLSREGIETKTSTNEVVNKKVEKITYDIQAIEKSGYPHYMLKEIFEQPNTIRDAFRGRILIGDGKVKLGGLTEVKEKLADAHKIIIIACGTSWHAALIGEHLIEEYCRIPVEVEYASEFRYRNPILSKEDIVIVISQSGETADTLAAMKEGKEKGALPLGIVNSVGSTIARESIAGVYIHAGPEIGVASTKAFTSQVTVLFLIMLMIARKKTMSVVTGQQLLTELIDLPAKVQTILAQSHVVEEVAEIYKDKKNFLYLGRGINFPVALEGALKLKEISYIHAEGYPAAEMKHGPIALIDEDMPVVFIATKDQIYDKVISNLEEVRARRGKIIAIASQGDKKIAELADHIIYIPQTCQALVPILAAIPLQLLAYYIAIKRGCDVDQPRNLAKSVTVE
ncbi:MAG: glutamine--fructose-6-phosphate transaminase (isomerizing) [Bacteroidetes bacterium]|nr:glutamine--fructose-6-phosphate transaminase (isomerizing) [Bacteroidota bacterium]